MQWENLKTVLEFWLNIAIQMEFQMGPVPQPLQMIILNTALFIKYLILHRTFSWFNLMIGSICYFSGLRFTSRD